MPKWGMTMKEGKVSRWFKNEGNFVQRGEVLFEVETDRSPTRWRLRQMGFYFRSWSLRE